jgi:hypothetical protein
MKNCAPARWYKSYLNRWIQPDSIIPELGNPQDFDRYSYCRNNPLIYRDPSGHWLESVIDIIFIGYDIYDINENGLTWENGLSLAADVAGLALPLITGGGLMVRAATHADDVADAARGINRIVPLSDEAIKAGNNLIKGLGDQLHHFATNKFSKKPPQWTNLYDNILSKYELTLDGLWNKDLIPQKGMHPDDYHSWVLNALEYIDSVAKGNQGKFIELFDELVKDPVLENPWILKYKPSWWAEFGDEWWEWWESLIN